MFGRRRRNRGAAQEPEPEGYPSDGYPSDGYAEDADPDAGELAEEGWVSGPYDAEDAPDDGRPRLDLGALRLPIPEGSQLQVEVGGQPTTVRAVHFMTPLGQVTVTAFAAPRSGGLWKEVSRELAARLREDGAQVRRMPGEWGDEIDAVTPQGLLRFLGVDGPRWMLRGVAVGSEERAEERAALLRDVVRETVVVRGPDPMPPRTMLPLVLPPALAEQLKSATPVPAPGTQGPVGG